MIKIKRVYDPIENDDGIRILVDRIWPRGIKKDKIYIWLKDIAPSNELRKWFNHDPNKWEEFKRRYFEELDKNSELNKLIEIIKNNKNVTLLYSAKSPYNNAVALKEYLEKLKII
ncbi:uroporphyrin-III methyltransferase [Nanoarchaeota archaeon]